MKIIVIGAYGYTGRLICEEFMLSGYLFSIAGRNKEKLQELQNKYPKIEKSECLDIRHDDVLSLVSKYDVFVNCAGPFTEESSRLIEEIARNQKVYLDICGEIQFIKSSRERLGKKANDSGSLIIHGAAFESLISDLMCRHIQETISINNVRSYYRFNQKRTSPGTRITMKLSKFRTPIHVENSDWSIIDFMKEHHHVRLNAKEEWTAIPYPLPEIAFSKWNYNVDLAKTYLLLEREEAKFVSPVLKSKDNLIPTLERLKKIKKRGPTAEESLKNSSEIFIIINENPENTWRLSMIDMYRITAKCICMLISEVLDGSIPFGIVSPSEVVRKQPLEALKLLGVSIEKARLESSWTK